MDKQRILQLQNITKVFPGVKALDDVHLEVYEGEVLALCGENGAGKSTLMKIIAGAIPYTSGKILLNQKEVRFHSTHDANAHGIAMVYQEFNMIPELSIAENMYLGRLPKNKWQKVDWNQLYQDAEANLKKLNLHFNVRKKVKHITVAEAQMVEIAKCLTLGSQVIIMDEPTAALAEEEIKVLFALIEDLKQHNIAVIYISHRMDEIFQISDRITVFRDGKYIDTKSVKETDYETIVSMMVGRNLLNLYPKRDYTRQNEVLRIENFKGDEVVSASFSLYQGEILGITGLLGSGTIELSKMIYGAIPKLSGEVYVNNRLANCSNPIRSLAAGIGFLSDDRKQEGLLLMRSILENISLSSLKEISTGWHLRRKVEKERALQQVDRLNIKLSSLSQLAGKLSGGNQQKVVLAKVLEANPEILILDEPTRGVDVGAKAEIYEILDQLTKEGKSIIIISTDLPEIKGICDRVIVMREGQIVKHLEHQDINQELILAHASGGIDNE